jgi:uncharacterized protein YjgD (DUF1641 family)
MSTEADLAGALAALNARLDRLEAKVDALSGGSQLPALADPKVQGDLGELLTRLDKATAMVDALGTLAERLPVLSDAAATGASWAWRQAEDAGIDPLATGKRAANLSLQLAQEENLVLVERLLTRRDDVVMLLDAADSVDADDLRTVATQGAALTKKLAKLLKTPELAKVLDATADPTALSTVEAATTALVSSRSEKIDPVGLFGVLGQMGDPDVQRAVGFTFALAKRFGQTLDK